MASPDPTDVAAYDELAKNTIGGAQTLTAPIEILDYDSIWPELYEQEAGRIRAVLGDRVVRLERFRDWLRANTADRIRYADTKRELATRDWKYMQQYADAKTAIVLDIMGRAAQDAG
jgi:GrpB-like predicted nucleotidyltransferase (UPF0157 family)